MRTNPEEYTSAANPEPEQTFDLEKAKELESAMEELDKISARIDIMMEELDKALAESDKQDMNVGTI